MQQTKLKKYFPMLKTREELLAIIHRYEQQGNTGVKLELLQKYIFITLDNFLKMKQNIDISNRLNAWLLFFASDDPEDIIRLIEVHPYFEVMYRQIYQICENVETVMGLFSEELAILDRNTVKFMMDEMQEEIDQKKAEIDQQKNLLAEKDTLLAQALAENKKLREALASDKTQD